MSKKKKSKSNTPSTAITEANSLKGLEVIDPEEILALQKSVFNVVKGNLPRARDVLTGKRRWDAQQTRLYLSLLDKVMPTLSQSYNISEVRKRPEDMTIQELQQAIHEEMTRISNPPATTAEELPSTTTSSPIIPLDPIELEPIDEPTAPTRGDTLS